MEILFGLLGMIVLVGIVSLFSGEFLTAMLCLGPIAAVAYFLNREPKVNRTVKRVDPFINQQVNISVDSDHENYYHYTAEFYRLVEVVACRDVWHEMEAVIQVTKLDRNRCSVGLHLDLDGDSLPEGILLGRGFELLSDSTVVRYKTENATGYTTPTLVRDMILRDMKPSIPGLRIDPIDVSLPLRTGDFPLLTIRFSVKYIPVD